MTENGEQKILTDLKQKLERLKRDVAMKEGERNSILERIKKDFNVKDLDAAYAMLEELGKDIEEKKTRREDLLKIAQEKLDAYKEK